MSASTDAWYRWQRLTGPRTAFMVAWLTGTAAIGLIYLWVSGYIGSIQWPFAQRQAALMALVASSSAAGPLGIWLLWRRMWWLLAGLLIFGSFAALALSYWIRSGQVPQPSL